MAIKRRVKKPYIAAIFLAFFVLFSVKNAMAVDNHNITNCTVLNETGTYYLMNDIIDADVYSWSNQPDPCIAIGNNSITLDCQGYLIDGVSDVINQPYGIATTNYGTDLMNNIIIKNCIVSDWRFDIDQAGYNWTIENNTALTAFGTAIQGDNYSLIENNTVKNSGNGIIITGNTIVENNTVENNTVCGLDISTVNGELNLIYFNTLNNTLNAQNESSLFSALNSSLGGNWWSDWQNCTCVYNANSPYGGICAEPYVLDENNTDYLPLCVAEQECVPSWNCTAWGECVRGTQTRTCYDNNFCDDNSTIPALSQQCIVPYDLPNATFNVTGGCCPVSTFACYDNDTVIQLWNTSDGVSFAFKDCQGLGCQNGDCNQPTWINALIIVIIAGVALYLIYKVV